MKDFSSLENRRDQINDAENGVVTKNDRRGKQKISRISETEFDIERKVSPIFMSSTLSEAMEEKYETEEEKFQNPISFVATSENKDNGRDNKQLVSYIYHKDKSILFLL